MENYIISIRDTALDNKFRDEFSLDYKEHLIEIKTIGMDITVASFHVPDDIKYNKELKNLQDKLHNNEEIDVNLFNCNGYVGIRKKNEYLTFETSIYGGDIWGVSNFTIKINESVDDMLKTLLS